MQLRGKAAVVTGAARGIGLEIARVLLKNGAKVSLLDVREEVGKEACSALQKEFSVDSVMFILVDVTNRDQLKAAFEETKNAFGSVDVVCNNAGIGGESKWRLIIEINLVAVIEGTFLAVDYMSTKKGGSGGVVVNTASLAGLFPVPKYKTYCASKHGVVGFTRSCKGMSETDGIRVNCICPGAVDTPLVRENFYRGLTDKQKAYFSSVAISADKVAEGVLELITDDTKSGAVLEVDHRGPRYPVMRRAKL